MTTEMTPERLVFASCVALGAAAYFALSDSRRTMSPEVAALSRFAAVLGGIAGGLVALFVGCYWAAAAGIVGGVVVLAIGRPTGLRKGDRAHNLTLLLRFHRVSVPLLLFAALAAIVCFVKRANVGG